MERYEENRVKWLIGKPGGLFLARRRLRLRRAGGKIIFKSILICLLLCHLFILAQNKNNINKCTCYKVYKILPINNYYQIYAIKDTAHYKIISKKDSVSVGIKIEIGKCYNFNLKSMADSVSTVNGVKLIPANYLDVEYLFEDTPIKIDGGEITDLYFADNLKGLYLIENSVRRNVHGCVGQKASLQTCHKTKVDK